MICYVSHLVKRSTWRRSFQVGWELYPPTTLKGTNNPFFGCGQLMPSGNALEILELDRTWQARLKIEVGRWKNERVHPKREVSSRTNVDQSGFLGGGGGLGSGIHPPRFSCLVFGPVYTALLNWWEAHWIDGFQVGDFFGRSFWVARILPQNTCRTSDKFSFCFWGKQTTSFTRYYKV